ncbi:MAG: nucleoside deaminase [Anaerococcus sp.]|uniref:nucleoside deaminase n=1 Tax=Anaerococcus sp. TaxID=1872515 RepID=UPI00261FD17B|nr:nucleoside deaminase [Anaerococcus sp.]MCI5972422.1 nucleoside deaminase [Anaerococcus sp.]MDD6920014.1 nucleoside deaminase [Eubacteriales bacterium]MDD7462899.1 nucleoside deaminase [Peptoniphilaceae bacterium]MDY3054560.1 nucleoside deaminase [Anaerococcus sp.]
MNVDYKRFLIRANTIAEESVMNGNNPFGAILIDKDGTILLECGNLEGTLGIATAHAELKLCEMASKEYDKEFLKTTTLITTAEPCSMCSGAIYWTGIGRVVYGISEKELKRLTGDDVRNLTMSLDCRKVLNSGQKKIEVIGPVNEVKSEIEKLHKKFWK